MPLHHFASPQFWRLYYALPKEVQELADKNFVLLKANPSHPSLHFKKIGDAWSVRVGRRYRALATERAEGLVWNWIGPHGGYDRLMP